MNIRVAKAFLSDFGQIKDPTFQEAFKEVLAMLETLNSMENHAQVKKVIGHDAAFRIGLGFYCIGLYQTGPNELTLMRLLHREHIMEVLA